MSKIIFSVFYPEDNKPEIQIEYAPGNQTALLSSLVEASLRNTEIRETLFSAVSNCIALADKPQEWLEALQNGVKKAQKNIILKGNNPPS